MRLRHAVTHTAPAVDAGAFGGAEDFLYDRFGRRTPGQRSKSTKGKLLSKMLPNHLELHPPNQEAHVSTAPSARCSPNAPGSSSLLPI